MKAGKLPAGLLDRRARGLHRAPELARQLRRLVHLPGPRRAHLRTPRCGARPRCSSRTTRTTASSTTSYRRTRRPPRRRACPPSTSRPTSTRATASYAAGPVRSRPARPDARRLARGAPAATSAPRSSTTPRSSGSWSTASACTSPTSRPGAGRSAATSPRPSTSAATDTRPGRPARTPTAYEPPDNDRHPDYVPTPPAAGSPAQAGARLPADPAAAATHRSSTAADAATGKFTLDLQLRRPTPAPQFLVTSGEPHRRPLDLHDRGRQDASPTPGTPTYSNGVVRPDGARPERLPAHLQGQARQPAPRSPPATTPTPATSTSP